MLVEVTMVEFREASSGTRYRKTEDYKWQRQFVGFPKWDDITSDQVPGKILTVAAEIRYSYQVKG